MNIPSITSYILEGLQDSLPIIEKGAPVLFTALGMPWAGTAISFLAQAFDQHPFSPSGISQAIINDPDSSNKLMLAEQGFLGAIKQLNVKQIDLHMTLDPNQQAG